MLLLLFFYCFAFAALASSIALVFLFIAPMNLDVKTPFDAGRRDVGTAGFVRRAQGAR